MFYVLSINIEAFSVQSSEMMDLFGYDTITILATVDHPGSEINERLRPVGRGMLSSLLTRVSLQDKKRQARGFLQWRWCHSVVDTWIFGESVDRTHL